MKYSEWKIPYSRPESSRELLEAGLSPLVAALLTARGLTDAAAAMSFLSGSAPEAEAPHELQGVGEAVRRIKTAMRNGEKIAVFGDYDVDGITAACLLGGYLRSEGLGCELYIPDRLEEGYGLNVAAIDHLNSLGVTLIITVDCGVTAFQETRYAASLGIDMIITDHHECRDTLPECVAVINPKRRPYEGFTELSGVGVAFKLVCAISGDAELCLNRYCDLVAIGTIADVMPLTGENRRITKQGLSKLLELPRPGFKALLDEAGITGEKLSAASVGYSIAPRINAAGRLGRASLAVSLLMTDSPDEGERLAKELCELNRSRRKIEQGIWEQALALLPEKPVEPIVIADSSWHQGVVGIVASRLTEEFSLPAVMICFDGDQGKGSCRSFGGFNLFDALTHCSGLLEGFGGHALAAGLTIRRENLEVFRREFTGYYRENNAPVSTVLEAELLVDSPELISLSCVDSLRDMEPCGNGNPRPLLCITDALLESVTPIGGGKHLRLRIEKFGRSFECVCFSCTGRELGLVPGDMADLVFYPQINDYHSRRRVQLLVTDIRPADDSGLCEEILSGGAALSKVISPHRPCRRDFARLWRAVVAEGGELEAPVGDALRTLGCGEGRVSACICLAVFAELGLVSLELAGGRLKITADPKAKRVELESSELLRRIL